MSIVGAPQVDLPESIRGGLGRAESAELREVRDALTQHPSEWIPITPFGKHSGDLPRFASTLYVSLATSRRTPIKVFRQAGQS